MSAVPSGAIGGWWRTLQDIPAAQATTATAGSGVKSGGACQQPGASRGTGAARGPPRP